VVIYNNMDLNLYCAHHMSIRIVYLKKKKQQIYRLCARACFVVTNEEAYTCFVSTTNTSLAI